MKRSTSVAVGITSMAVVLSLVSLLGPDAPGRGPAGTSDAVPGPVALPHCGGEQITAEEAFNSSPYVLTMPESGLATDSSLTAVWRCPGTATLLEFSTGVTLVLDVNTIVDPEASWKRLSESNPEVYSVGTVQGVPASLIDPAGDVTKTAEGGVTFVKDGIYVSLGGDGTIPLSSLVETAESLGIAKSSA